VDLNASIGMRSTNNSSNDDKNDPSVYLLGPHGNPRWNTRGELIIGMLNQQELRLLQPSSTPTIIMKPGFTLQPRKNINRTTF